jgi:2-polyprenyl-3-methyl-5-hydroxy-6-metoxy-1,4-benzoquinol methylase
MSHDNVHYGNRIITFLEAMWGEGFLSPGGPDEVARVLDGIDLRGKRVLDIGCGAGGITAMLAYAYGASEVVGIDVEAPVCVAARALAKRKGVAGRVTIRQVTPGPFPFPDNSFDVVFSKDSIVHIADKEVLGSDVFRGPFFLSTYRDTKINSSLSFLFTSGWLQTCASIFLQLMQAFPVKSIIIGLFTFLEYSRAW